MKPELVICPEADECDERNECNHDVPHTEFFLCTTSRRLGGEVCPKCVMLGVVTVKDEERLDE